jgi:hypothetical protein
MTFLYDEMRITKFWHWVWSILRRYCIIVVGILVDEDYV